MKVRRVTSVMTQENEARLMSEVRGRVRVLGSWGPGRPGVLGPGVLCPDSIRR